jgi:hypothetical protein
MNMKIIDFWHPVMYPGSKNVSEEVLASIFKLKN